MVVAGLELVVVSMAPVSYLVSCMRIVHYEFLLVGFSYFFLF